MSFKEGEKMSNRNDFIGENTNNDIQVPGFTLFEGYARLPYIN